MLSPSCLDTDTHNIQLFLALMSCEPTCPRCASQCVTSVVWKRKGGWKIEEGKERDGTAITSYGWHVCTCDMKHMIRVATKIIFIINKCASCFHDNLIGPKKSKFPELKGTSSNCFFHSSNSLKPWFPFIRRWNQQMLDIYAWKWQNLWTYHENSWQLISINLTLNRLIIAAPHMTQQPVHFTLHSSSLHRPVTTSYLKKMDKHIPIAQSCMPLIKWMTNKCCSTSFTHYPLAVALV